MWRANVDVVRAGVDAFVARDFDALTRLYTPGASGTASGVSLNTNVAPAYRLEDGQMAEACFYWKWEDALQAAGLRE